MKLLIILYISLLIFSISIFSQPEENKNVWEPIQYFIGEWEGESTGKAGCGKGKRIYEFIMNDTYLFYQNTMVFDRQEKNPDGEVHKDQTYYSYDENRKFIVACQFNIEGFVNQYVLDSVSLDGKYLRFTSEMTENAPPGLIAILAYEIKNENEFIETFDLGFVGKEFSCWMTNFWKRKLN